MRLVADKLAVARGNRTILAGLSFELEAGDSLVLTGPNGAGKTTLIRTLAGLIPPAAGDLWLDGGEPDQSLGEASHYVGHLNAIKSILTVAENVGFWSRFCGGAAPQRDAALAAFGLSQLADIPAAYLSAGQKRRLGLARLLLAPRPLWLLDEPTAALDAAAEAALAAAVAGHLAAGGVVVAATHQPLPWRNQRQLRLEPAAPGP